ncbi:hypothetical protein LBMAG48_29840 [Phycisphaerae bacterium]|jgi:preprotein translocase subunit YajC|nr:hypothetical protein LBMAG48_29840 [Phycisphaerae bacterium]
MNSFDSPALLPASINAGDVHAFFTLAQDTAPASQPVVVPGMTNAAPAAAQTTGATTGTPSAVAAPGGTTGAAQPAPASAWLMPVMLLLMLVFMVGISAWSGRKQKKQREAMMSALKKGDKVITGGGVIGNIVDMNDDEIVLRVEEGRIRFSRGAIQGVVGGSKGSSLTETKEASKTVNV